MRHIHAFVVLGEYPNEKGQINKEFKARLEAALEQFRKGNNSIMVITGGQTRSEFEAESLMALKWLHGQRFTPPLDFSRILCEDKSKSTSENIQLVAELLARHPHHVNGVTIFARKSQIPKTIRFVTNIWGYSFGEVSYVACLDTKPLWWRALDLTVNYVLASVDPYEKWTRKIKNLRHLAYRHH